MSIAVTSASLRPPRSMWWTLFDSMQYRQEFNFTKPLANIVCVCVQVIIRDKKCLRDTFRFPEFENFISVQVNLTLLLINFRKFIINNKKWILYDNPKRRKSWVDFQLSTSTAKSNIHAKKVLMCEERRINLHL